MADRGASGRPLRIHVLFESQDQQTPNGSSYIRLLRPLGHPSVAARVALSFGAEMTKESVDLVMIDRLWRGDLTPERQSVLLRSLAARGIPYIHSIDDNLLDLNLEPGQAAHPSPLQRNLVREFVRSAAGLIVSTGPLADRLRPLNGNVVVVPNQLDETLFEAAPARARASADGARVVIGYMGTYSHLDDLMMIAHPLRRLLGRNRGKVRLEFVGVAGREELLGLFPGAEVDVLRVPGASVVYPEFVAWMRRTLKWDLALGPLRINDFNRSKSDIKWLDYGMLAIPGIFSAAPAYEQSVDHEVTGLLVPNSSEAWAAALQSMVDSAARRADLSAAVRHRVSSTRTLSVHAMDWIDAVDRILGARAGPGPAGPAQRFPAVPARQWAASPPPQWAA